MSDPGHRQQRWKSWLLFGLLIALAAGLPALAYWWFHGKGARRGPGGLEVKIDSSKGHRLLVNGEPFFIRGVCYNPVPPGQGHDYDFWGKGSPALAVDGPLMRDAHINTVRFYRAGAGAEEVRAVVQGLYEKYGVHTLLGHHLGFWEWPPPEYGDPEFRAKIQQEVLEMVRTHKDTPGVIGWILGNENNYSFDLDVRRWSSPEIDALPTEEEQRRARAQIYYSWINDMAKAIHAIDKRPVIMGVGETRSLELAAKHAPDIDILGMIAYRGPSFGNLFREVRQKMDKPVMLIEFGADRFNAQTQMEEENYQAEFIKQQWREILKNSAGVGGARNCVGGTLFEWNDEWWKGSDMMSATWSVQDSAAHWRNAAYYFDADKDGVNNMNEEWWGIVRMDPSRQVNGHAARVPTKAYRLLQHMWKGKSDED